MGSVRHVATRHLGRRAGARHSAEYSYSEEMQRGTQGNEKFQPNLGVEAFQSDFPAPSDRTRIAARADLVEQILMLLGIGHDLPGEDAPGA